ncbi:hypothetical protein CHGG_08083 [Chaetomium globosum CBS 148.51]|uniref:UDP-N-acetylglucosamine transferase subunit ALG14 n=1 Tax=Chaetomium globosum (strain ATCC 6205 / CBS 148.51 / DSM 1962 / NBRC 6347 / NRRL 1970) TaxID=306901 RepID=Q2GVC1_CHAGB|nr:uncharacterized protein CHGG_08083 [Chaetomium globosum CBS 148.51]EAQ86830.1 hypothetical protein CHGG_08083 [Chaetomium globosum CBS 148.51]
MEKFIRDMIEDFGPDRFAFFVYLGLVCIGMISIAGLFLLPWSSITTIITGLVTFVIGPRQETGRRWISRRDPSTPNTTGLPAVYFLYILGSGGHTSEMLETIKRKFVTQTKEHHNYLVTTGDKDSLNRVIKLECLISAASQTTTTARSKLPVPRARRVHQPFWTAPFTCLQTAIHAINALTREPDVRYAERHPGNPFKYPHVIITNGPATGFIVCLVAHLLKLFYLVPRDRLKMVYVESWARCRSLSLTGPPVPVVGRRRHVLRAARGAGPEDPRCRLCRPGCGSPRPAGLAA